MEKDGSKESRGVRQAADARETPAMADPLFPNKCIQISRRLLRRICLEALSAAIHLPTSSLEAFSSFTDLLPLRVVF